MPRDSNKIEIAWGKLAQFFQLKARLTSGETIHITASEIKKVTGEEPRLMTKFDCRENRPSVLKNATVLAIENGLYAVVPGDGYLDIAQCLEPRTWQVPAKARALRTLPWDRQPSSESQAIDMAFASGMLADFLGESELFLTMRGRLRCDEFSFEFAGTGGPVSLKAKGVQVEVDGGFEGNEIYLVEAKLGHRTNINLRQLYYPWRMWSATGKRVNVVVLVCSNRQFRFRRYTFSPALSFNGIVELATRDYVLDEAPALPDASQILTETTQRVLSPEIPFPQADDINRVIDVVDAVALGDDTADALANRYDFDARQSDYYANAAAFAGFVSRNGRRFELTADGERFAGASARNRQILLAREVASLPVFRPTIEWLATRGELPAANMVAQWIAKTAHLGESTSQRRAQTVLAWCRWLFRPV